MSPLNCRCTQLYDLEAAIRLAFGMVSQRPAAACRECPVSGSLLRQTRTR